LRILAHSAPRSHASFLHTSGWLERDGDTLGTMLTAGLWGVAATPACYQPTCCLVPEIGPVQIESVSAMRIAR
jgi:hypothetical protein